MLPIKSVLGPIGLSICLCACGPAKLRPMHALPGDIDCQGGLQQSEAIFSDIEMDLWRAGAFKSEKMKLFSGVWMMEKSARLYVVNRQRHVLVLHFMRDVDLGFNRYDFELRGDSAMIASGVLKVDTRHITGNLLDEYLYYDLSRSDLERMATSGNLEISLDGFWFQIPALCQEPFRKALDVVRSPGGRDSV